jgi:acyl carrier protein
MNQPQPRQADLEKWLVELLAELLEIPALEIDVTAKFERYGLDSAAAVSVTAELEQFLGRTLDATLLYDYPTIRSLAEHLASGNG